MKLSKNIVPLEPTKTAYLLIPCNEWQQHGAHVNMGAESKLAPLNKKSQYVEW
jgi:hypothetical protein